MGCGWNWGLWYQKQVYQALMSSYIPQITMVCNYVSLPEIHASGAKVHNRYQLCTIWYNKARTQCIIVDVYCTRGESCEKYFRSAITVTRGIAKKNKGKLFVSNCQVNFIYNGNNYSFDNMQRRSNLQNFVSKIYGNIKHALQLGEVFTCHCRTDNTLLSLDSSAAEGHIYHDCADSMKARK